MKHPRWGDKVTVTPHKTETACLDCGIVKVARHEWEASLPRHWTEFWRGLDRIECVATPACERVEDTAS